MFAYALSVENMSKKSQQINYSFHKQTATKTTLSHIWVSKKKYSRQVSEYSALVNKYAGAATFLTIYIREAHPMDGEWPDDESHAAQVRVKFLSHLFTIYYFTHNKNKFYTTTYTHTLFREFDTSKITEYLKELGRLYNMI